MTEAIQHWLDLDSPALEFELFAEETTLGLNFDGGCCASTISTLTTVSCPSTGSSISTYSCECCS